LTIKQKGRYLLANWCIYYILVQFQQVSLKGFMMNILIFVSYVLVMLGFLGIYVRRQRRWFFGSDVDLHDKWYREGTYKYRGDFFFTAFVTSLLWPIAIPICFVASFFVWWMHLFIKKD